MKKVVRHQAATKPQKVVRHQAAKVVRHQAASRKPSRKPVVRHQAATKLQSCKSTKPQPSRKPSRKNQAAKESYEFNRTLVTDNGQTIIVIVITNHGEVTEIFDPNLSNILNIHINSKKIEAIKLIREVCGVGLYGGKQIAEAIVQKRKDHEI